MNKEAGSDRRGASRLRSDAGLTLLEVLLALALLGMGLAVIMEGLATGLQVRRRSTRMQALGGLAENRLNRLLSEGRAPSSTEEGEEGPYRWRVESALPAASKEAEVPALGTVKITVESPGGGSWEIVTLLPLEEQSP